MSEAIVGSFDGRHLRIGLVASRFNRSVVDKLVAGARDCCLRHGVREENLFLAWVPGAFELPLVARKLASWGRVDAIVCLGAVIRGETPHFEYVAGQAAAGIAQVGAETGIPVTFGVLTTETQEQAEARAGGKAGNKGFDAALSAIEMANLISSLSRLEA